MLGAPTPDFRTWETMNPMARKRRLPHRRWSAHGFTRGKYQGKTIRALAQERRLIDLANGCEFF